MNVLEDELQEINKTISIYKQLLNNIKQDLQESNKTECKTGLKLKIDEMNSKIIFLEDRRDYILGLYNVKFVYYMYNTSFF